MVNFMLAFIMVVIYSLLYLYRFISTFIAKADCYQNIEIVLHLTVLIIMVILKCYFSGEHIALSIKKTTTTV